MGLTATYALLSYAERFLVPSRTPTPLLGPTCGAAASSWEPEAQSPPSLGRHAPAFVQPRWSAGIPVIPSAPFLAPTTLFLCIHSWADESLNGELFRGYTCDWAHRNQQTFTVWQRREFDLVCSWAKLLQVFFPRLWQTDSSEPFFPLLLIKKWRRYSQPSVAVHTSESTTFPKVVRNS